MDHAEAYTSLLEHFATYFAAVDRGDVDTVVRLLDGATVVVGGAELSEPAAIRGAYETRRQLPGPDGRLATKHHVTNLRVAEPAADGTLEATAYYFRLEPGADGPVIATTGRLRQEVAPRGKAWRVRRHEIITDFARGTA